MYCSRAGLVEAAAPGRVFWLRLEACLNFIAGAQYKSVMDEYLQRVTNGFTVLDVMKAILEMAHFHGLMCALSTKQLLH